MPPSRLSPARGTVLDVGGVDAVDGFRAESPDCSIFGFVQRREFMPCAPWDCGIGLRSTVATGMAVG